MKKNILFLALTMSILSMSCSKEDSSDSEANNVSVTTDQAKVNSKIDLATDDISDIVEAQFDATMQDDDAASRSVETAVSISNLPDCATITRNPDFGATLAPGTQVTKTIDFGTSGCNMANGNSVKGQIVISFTYSPGAASQTINYEFVDFYHNDIKITGNRTFTRTISNVGGAHPVVVMNMDLTATFPDGSIYHRNGTRTREINAGHTTPLNFLDNEYEVTGNWNTTFPNSAVLTTEITTPLQVKMSCANIHKPLLVKGIVTFTANGNTSTLDYGDGNCDNLAVFTFNGNSYNIVIGN